MEKKLKLQNELNDIQDEHKKESNEFKYLISS